MKHIFRLFIVLLFVGSFTACKKDNDDDKPKSKTELLTAKNWRLSAAVVSGTYQGTSFSEDGYANADPCEKDNFLKFNSNKTVAYDQGPTKCDDTAADPQTEQGAWDFNSDESKLLLSNTGGGATFGLDILELTASTLKVEYSESDTDGTYKYTLTYTAF